MANHSDKFWISVFQRSGQRFVCSICGYSGEFNSFRLIHTETGSDVLFFCPTCNNNLIFDTDTKSMRGGTGEMVRPEVSLGGGWSWISHKALSLASLGVSLVILVLVSSLFFKVESQLGRLEDRHVATSFRPGQAPAALGQVDLKDPGAQEIGQGYAILPKSTVSESGGVRVRGVVVNEKALTVDAEFRFSLGGHEDTFTVADLPPGSGEPFEVFLPGAAEPSGPALVEVVETNLHLD